MDAQPIAANTASSDRPSSITIRVTILCSLIMIADSYDVSALSFAAPDLISKWHIDKLSVGTVFSTSLFGLMIGSVLFGFIGDRFGRKAAILIGTAIFSVLTAATGLAASYPVLLGLRFLACVGLGGAVPNAVALTNEYSPPRAGVTMIAWIFAGYALGGTLGGFVAAQIMPAFGWPAIFYSGRENAGYLRGEPLAVSGVEGAGIRTLLAVPMLKDNDAIGAIVIYRKEVRPFVDKQIELVTNFARQAVIAMRIRGC